MFGVQISGGNHHYFGCRRIADLNPVMDSVARRRCEEDFTRGLLTQVDRRASHSKNDVRFGVIPLRPANVHLSCVVRGR